MSDELNPDWIKAAKVGDKIVALDDFENCPCGKLNMPERGKIYTIREIGAVASIVFFRLVEVVNIPLACTGFDEAAFAANGFRPLEKRETDISVFTEMLTTTKVKEPA